MEPKQQPNGSLVPARHAGEVLRQEFGVEQIERRGETASVAIAAREKAAVEARYIVAMRNPRDVDNFRVRLLKECRRSGFAETAEYERPVGREKDEETGEWKQKIARGPSIRLIETATQHFGNLDAVAPIIFESEEFRIVQARMTDLETNTSWSQDIIVPKRVEKRGFGKGAKAEPPKGREIISQRVNSGGDITYLVSATDAEVNQLQTSMISKAQRKNGERLLPSDIIHEAVEACRRTLEAVDSEDPDGAKRKIIDNFANLNIMPRDLVEFLGKPIDRLQPSELKQLRGLFVAITNGELSWEEALKARDAAGSKEEQQTAAAEKLNALRKKESSNQATTDATAGVMPRDLVEFLGKPIDRLQPSELKQLRGLFVAITNGELSWEEALKARDAAGSKEEQQTAAAEKLNALRKKESSNQATTDATAGGKPATASAQPEAATGGQATSEPGTAAPSAPENTVPKKDETQRHILDLRAWRETLGGELFGAILGAHGYQAINDVPVETFQAIQEALALAAQDRGKAAPTPADDKPKRLQFGGKKP